MTVKSVLRAGAFGAALLTSGLAAAVPLVGSLAIGAGSFSDTVLLDRRTVYSPATNAVAGLNTSGVTGNLASLRFAQNAVFSAFTTATPSSTAIPSTFTVTGGNFTFTATSVAVIQATPNAADFFFTGNVATTAPGFEGGVASFRSSAVRNGSDLGGYTVAFGGVLAVTNAPGGTFPVDVPEPATLAVLGAGLFALAAVRRRRA